MDQEIDFQVEPITDDEFKRFQKLLHDTAGIFLPPAKKVLVQGRLNKRLRAHGFTRFGQYYRLVTDPAQRREFQVMVDCLTTNETYFFREPAHFEYLKTLLPGLASKGPVRVWSAASSTGEEIYTLAMVLAETLRERPWEVIGSDINSQVLQQARRGLYSLERTQGIAPELMRKYCLKGVRAQAGYFLIDKPLRARTRFTQINLKDDLGQLGKFQVIFLRNVMIYFDPGTKKDVVERIIEALVPGGYFFISHSESLHGITSKLKMVRPSVFQKA
ncbi:MAG: SAM-dependent methyltransferase [Gammaproteobacteria bacterium SHHR-1]|uniref:CheR family methyltransferase n=1 Tax=Magnetovirga frankeli TaxID=947516 RepID=UPI001293AE81|nr:SAM-dependent methyltransferase [gamma proteobacterium SS-5]